MSEKKYSLDDILNEYSGGNAPEGDGPENAGELDIDNINSGESAGAPGVPKEKPRGTDAADDGFTEKYEKLFSAVTAVKEREEQAVPYTPAPKPDRSFSEKFEEPNLYGDKEPENEDKAGISSLLRKRGRKQETAEPSPKPGKNPEPPIQSVSGDSAPEENPFDKFSSLEAAGENTEERSRRESAGAGYSGSLEDILNEYAEKERKKPAAKNENTLHKSITDFFTKLVPKPEEPEPGISGNTELLDGMLKAKKERISRTRHDAAPIERASIDHIDLNLDGKIMPDTSKLPDTEQQSELEKINDLKERRSKKIKDFVLVGDEEDVPGEESGEGEPVVIDDFEDLSDAPSIAHDIAQLKGSLMLRLLVLVLCLAASLYIALANDLSGLPVMEMLNKRQQTNTYLFVNAIIGLLAAFSSYTVISCGLSKLVSFKADCDSLCAVSVVSSLIADMIMFANGNLVKGSYVHVYVPAAIASLLFNTLGKLMIVSRTQKSFRFVSGGGDKYAIFPVEDDETAENFTRGALNDFPRLAAMRKTELLEDFLKTSYANDSVDRFCRIFTPIVLIAAALIGVAAGVMGRTEFSSSSVYIGISVFVGVTTICTGFSSMLTVNVPMSRSSAKNAELGGVIIGYDSVEEFADTNSILVDAEQLFPQGSVKLSAIKVFSDTRIDEAIVEAASLTTQAGSILKNMFYDIIGGKTEMLNPVESYIFEDSMGLCGWINNKRVLLGNRELMTNHSIEGVPSLAKEREYTESGRCAVYLSISGELSAMFLVEITPTMEVRSAFRELQKNGIYCMIRTVDSLVSINRLSELFDISPEYLKLIPFRVHEQFAEVTAYRPRQKATLACSGRFSALVSLILSCRRMKTTIGFGIGLLAVSTLLGILICLVMVVTGNYQGMSVSMMMLYNFIFTAVLVIFQLLRKN